MRREVQGDGLVRWISCSVAEARALWDSAAGDVPGSWRFVWYGGCDREFVHVSQIADFNAATCVAESTGGVSSVSVNAYGDDHRPRATGCDADLQVCGWDLDAVLAVADRLLNMVRMGVLLAVWEPALQRHADMAEPQAVGS